MKIEISGHHLEITEDIRRYVTEKAEGLRHFFDGVTSVHVMLQAEKERRIAEVVAKVSHGAPVVARAVVEGENVYTAINFAVDKVETQLRKHKDKVRDRRIREAAAEGSALPGLEESAEIEEEDEPPAK